MLLMPIPNLLNVNTRKKGKILQKLIINKYLIHCMCNKAIYQIINKNILTIQLSYFNLLAMSLETGTF